MWIKANTDRNLKRINLEVFDNELDETVEFNENKTANVEENVGAWLIENYDGIDIEAYDKETETEDFN